MVGATDGNGIALSWCMAQKQESQEEGDGAAKHCKEMLCDTCQHSGSTTHLPADVQHAYNQRAREDDIRHDKDTK